MELEARCLREKSSWDFKVTLGTFDNHGIQDEEKPEKK